MKKLTLSAAIAMLTASGAASAITIYEDDNKNTPLKDIQIQIFQDAGENEDAVDFDDSELKNNITYKLNNGIKAFAQLDLIPKETT